MCICKGAFIEIIVILLRHRDCLEIDQQKCSKRIYYFEIFQNFILPKTLFDSKTEMNGIRRKFSELARTYFFLLCMFFCRFMDAKLSHLELMQALEDTDIIVDDTPPVPTNGSEPKIFIIGAARVSFKSEVNIFCAI